MKPSESVDALAENCTNNGACPELTFALATA